jgi:hypothetical protein
MMLGAACRPLFCTPADLEMELLEFQQYYNGHRAPGGAEGKNTGIDPGVG